MDSAILLVDSDLGFLLWLGQALHEAGFQAYPAESLSDAVALVGQFHLTLGVLILNCSSHGAESFLATLRGSQKYFKTICLDGDKHPPCMRGVDRVCRKPVEINEESKALWVQAVRALLLGNRKVS